VEHDTTAPPTTLNAPAYRWTPQSSPLCEIVVGGSTQAPAEQLAPVVHAVPLSQWRHPLTLMQCCTDPPEQIVCPSVHIAQTPPPVLDDALVELVAVDPVEAVPLAVEVAVDPLPPLAPLLVVLPPTDVPVAVPVTAPPPLPPGLPLFVHPTTTTETASTAEWQKRFIVPAAFATRMPKPFLADSARRRGERVLEDSTIAPGRVLRAPGRVYRRGYSPGSEQ